MKATGRTEQRWQSERRRRAAAEGEWQRAASVSESAFRRSPSQSRPRAFLRSAQQRRTRGWWSEDLRREAEGQRGRKGEAEKKKAAAKESAGAQEGSHSLAAAPARENNFYANPTAARNRSGRVLLSKVDWRDGSRLQRSRLSSELSLLLRRVLHLDCIAEQHRKSRLLRHHASSELTGLRRIASHQLLHSQASKSMAVDRDLAGDWC